MTPYDQGMPPRRRRRIDPDSDPEIGLAIAAVTAAQQRADEAYAEWQRLLDERRQVIREHAPAIKRFGWRPFARAVGTLSEGTLRGEARRD